MRASVSWMVGVSLLCCAGAGLSGAQNPVGPLLTLEDAVRRALSANRSIASASDDATRASHALTATKSQFELQVAPRLDATRQGGEPAFGVGLALSQKLPFGAIVSAVPGVTRGAAGYGVSLDLLVTQSLTRGFSPAYTLSPVRQSESMLRQAQQQLVLTRTQVVLQTIAAVYNIIRSREVVNLQQASYNRVRSHQETALLKQRIGLASEIDVYRTKISLKQAESALLSSREASQDALDNLGIILSLSVAADTDVRASLDVPAFEIDERHAVPTASEHRIELMQLQEAVDMAQRDTMVARRNLLPDVDLIGRYSINGADTGFRSSVSSAGGEFGVGVTLSGNARRTTERMEYENMLLAVRAVERQRDLRRDEIAREVRFALRSKQRTGQDIRLREEQVWQVRGKLELAKVKFVHGMASNFDVIESESELRNAEIELLSARIEAIQACYALKAALGTLLDGEGNVTGWK